MDTNKKIKDIYGQFVTDMKALTTQHLEKVAAFQKAQDELTKFNTEVWKPGRQKLIAKFRADRDEIKKTRLQAREARKAEKEAKKAEKAAAKEAKKAEKQEIKA